MSVSKTFNFPTLKRTDAPLICASFWGVAVWFPVAVTYIALLVTWLAILFSQDLAKRWAQALKYKPCWISLSFFIWIVLSFIYNPSGQYALSMVFHVACFHITILAALMIWPEEASAAWLSFLVVGIVMLILLYINTALVHLPHLPGLRDLFVYSGNKSIRAGLLMCLMSLFAFSHLLQYMQLGSLKLSCKAMMSYRFLLLLIFFVFTAIAVMFFIHTRTAMLILPIALFILIIRNNFTISKALIAALLLVILSVGVYKTSNIANERMQMAVTNLYKDIHANAPSSSTGLRFYFYRFSYHEMVKHPFMGMGLGTWHAKWSLMYPEYGWFANPHSDYMLFGSEAGIPAAILLLLVYVIFLVQSMRVKSVWGSIAVAATIVAALTATVNAGMRDAVFGLSLVWLMATAYRAACGDIPDKSTQKSSLDSP